jgi:hypothetical protein
VAQEALRQCRPRIVEVSSSCSRSGAPPCTRAFTLFPVSELTGNRAARQATMSRRLCYDEQFRPVRIARARSPRCVRVRAGHIGLDRPLLQTLARLATAFRMRGYLSQEFIRASVEDRGWLRGPHLLAKTNAAAGW